MDPASVALSPPAVSRSASLCALARAFVGDLLAPRGCAACEEQLSRRALFCPACAASVEPAPPTRLAGLPVVAGALYGGAVVQAVRELSAWLRDREAEGRAGAEGAQGAPASPALPSLRDEERARAADMFERLRAAGYDAGAALEAATTWLAARASP